MKKKKKDNTKYVTRSELNNNDIIIIIIKIANKNPKTGSLEVKAATMNSNVPGSCLMSFPI